MNKKTTNLLILLTISFVFFKFFGYLLVPIRNGIPANVLSNEISVSEIVLAALELFALYGFNLLLGFVLLSLAKTAGFHRGLWFGIGAVFGMLGLLLFFVLDLRSSYMDSHK